MVKRDIWAEGEGFEPSILSDAGFQDRCTKPLCDPSKNVSYFTIDHGTLNLMTDSSSNSGQNGQLYPEQQLPPTDVISPPVEGDIDIQDVPDTVQASVDSASQDQVVSPPVPPPSFSDYPANPDQPLPETVLLEWQAPNRPFKKRNRQYYTTIGVIVFLICMILFFAGQFLPIAVVIAVAFLAYVLSAVPPEMVTNRITTYGVRADDNLYHWDEFGRFWFTEKYHQKLLHFEVTRFPGELTLVVTDQDEAELKDILGTVLINEKPPLGSFDKAAQWLQEKVPLDTEA